MKTNKLTVSVVLFVLFAGLAGCKDDIPALEYHSQGFVKGTISGTTSGQTLIDESFRYTQYQQTVTWGEGYTGYVLNEDGSLEVIIFRQDVIEGGYIYTGFELEDEDDTTPDNAYLGVIYYEESDKILYFAMSSDGENTLEISDFEFDIATGRTSGSFSLEGPSNSSGNEAEVEGSFEVKLKQFVR